VQLAPGVDPAAASASIKDVRMKRPNPPGYKPEFFLQTFSDLHLYNEWSNGVPAGGRIRYVWLFSLIGMFILLLACINFMNLSTARSEKRAREVGIRTAVGSVRSQLIFQFFSESLVVAGFSFVLALLLVSLALPFFNELAGKHIAIPYGSPTLWLAGICFSLLTGLIAGSYPALYLSSFKPVKALKGSLRVGRFAAVPRQVLVVLQFSVSVALIIGTVVVFRQIDFARDRAMGYNPGKLIEVRKNTPELFRHINALRTDLLATGAVAGFAEAFGSITDQNNATTDFSWEGKTPNTSPVFMGNFVTHEFGETVGWELVQGRDFSRDYAGDTAAIILNEAAVKFIGLKKPVGEVIQTNGGKFTVIGVVKDLVRESPFEMVKPGFYVLGDGGVDMITIRLAPALATRDALVKIEAVFKQHNPAGPFDFTFVDQQYALKFSGEARIGKLAGVFASLAIFISSLGIFGLASFIAERRTKEIGIRKVLGASVGGLWRMLSREFVILVLVAMAIAMPVAYYAMHSWLELYAYRTSLPWWIFAASGTGALAITLLTVSYQSIRAAVANPVRSLRME
jgi:putative ABC transport system permease protein